MKKITLMITALFTIGISSCKKDFLALTVNPNTPSVTTPDFTLTGAEKIAADIPNGFEAVGGGTAYAEYAVWVGYWTSSGNYVPSAALQEYQFTTSSYQVWTDLYSNLTNLNILETLGASTPANANYQAIAKILKAYDFEQLVDNYNNVPYSQAFQASTNFFPAYDSGSSIYLDLIKQCDNAISIIAKSGTTAIVPTTSDIIFGGNMTNWAKFANTLKLRLILRLVNTTYYGGVSADIAATASTGYLDGTTMALAQPGYSLSDATGGQESPFWHAYGTNASGNPTGDNLYYRAGDYFVKLMQLYNDPRSTYFFALAQPPGTPAGTTPSIIRGNVFGDPNALQNPYTSAIGPGLLKSPSMPAVLFGGWESLFLQAEAVQRGVLTSGSSAEQLYEAGITASFTYLGLTAAQAQAYYSQNQANVGWAASSADPIQAIITQKYISLNGYSNLEAFNEYRRTGYPVGVPRSIDPAAVGTTNVSRVFYPASEYQQNGTAVNAQGTINPFTSLIFWAKAGY